MSASSKKPRRAWAKQNAGAIGSTFVCLGSPRLMLGLQRRQGTRKVRWKIVRRCHEAIESNQAADSNRKNGYPIRGGRWVS
ncbi:hypothetical protein [Bradyrhizobium sp. CW10]|uniref:hypothetical protein n=1 Tax=Bradyrhizobium sp. CW10 TaxID=2782683 RepID=UPI0023DE9D66|nr:hypothetical protein [Bradyrhizobium sp. CW10]MCK1465865.1 hypothetical protein [Bradyrhizobium sp. CW10]